MARSLDGTGTPPVLELSDTCDFLRHHDARVVTTGPLQRDPLPSPGHAPSLEVVRGSNRNKVAIVAGYVIECRGIRDRDHASRPVVAVR
jgi:hypothetical protein